MAARALLWQLLPLLLLFSLLGCSSALAATSRNKTKKPSVIIIGAGMSGIMAAKTLSEGKVDEFLILEATDRIGGRMWQTQFAGYTIELGANWVEGVGGTKENPIWTLAQKYNLRTSYSDFDNVSFNIYSQTGKLLPQSVVSPRYNLAEAAYNFSNSLSNMLTANGGEDVSISTAQRLFGLVPSTPLDMAIDYFNYDFEIAEPPRLTSLKNVLPNPTFVYFGEDEYFVADTRGYAHIVDQLAKEFLEHDNGSIDDTRLELNKVVTHIGYSPHGIKVVTEDNSTYHADYAILSVSLGVLKSNLITYKPDLPYWKIKTFYQFDMAIYTKIFLKFPYKFWPTGPGTEFFLYADGKRGYYPFWQHLEAELPGSHILFVTITDDESRRIEQQSDEQTKAEIMEVLRRLFGENIPEPQHILVPRWWENRFFGGSYTNWPIGVSERDFDRMKAPVGSLYFTGEHTNDKFNGYVHGAYLAGIATAQTLLDCIYKGKCKETTSDGLPWQHNQEPNPEVSATTNCSGACCHEVFKDLEEIRQTYISAIADLGDALAMKYKP